MVQWLDPDPGIGRAVLYSFREKVIKNTLQVCLVKIQKDLTLSEKKTLLANSDEFWEEEQRKQPSLSEVQLLEHIIERQLLEESYQSSIQKSVMGNCSRIFAFR